MDFITPAVVLNSIVFLLSSFRLKLDVHAPDVHPQHPNLASFISPLQTTGLSVHFHNTLLNFHNKKKKKTKSKKI